MAVLTADSIGKQFDGRRVLTAATLRVASGEVRGLVGRNGAGKTTLLRIAAGLMVPDSGIVIWRERRMLRARLHRLAREGVLFLPADGVLAPGWRLDEQLRLVAATFPGGSVDAAVDSMRLEDCHARPVHQLSGGERRRANVAVSLIRRPSCLLADEPFRDLAPLDCELIGDALRAFATGGCAVMITGHELPFVMRFADHITWCTNGTTLELGPPAHAERNHAFRAGLGVS
jgi:ABC-type multidrug transport system ATPase subunit